MQQPEDKEILPDVWWWGSLMWLLEHVAARIARFWARTWRYEFQELDNVRKARKLGPVFIGSWHGNIFSQTLFGCDRGIVALVSPVWEGEIIARLLQGLGFELIRGSSGTSRLGGFRESIRVLREGRILTAAMDGPEGPAKIVKPGIVTTVAAGKGVVLPVFATGTPAFRLHTWDRHEIPLPFARMIVRFGEPVAFPVRPRGETIERYREKIEISMLQLEKEVRKGLDAGGLFHQM